MENIAACFRISTAGGVLPLRDDILLHKSKTGSPVVGKFIINSPHSLNSKKGGVIYKTNLTN